jgi:hypothetical protein
LTVTGSELSPKFRSTFDARRRVFAFSCEEMVVRKNCLAFAVFAFVSLGGGTLQAASQSFPWSDPNSYFEIQNDNTCGLAGFSFRDYNAYSLDNGGLVSVNGTYIGTGATQFDLSSADSDALAAYSQVVGDLGVTVSYRISSANIVRTMVTITNNSTTDAVSVPVNIESTIPSDSRIYYVDGGTWRSSGDWFVVGEAGEPDDTPPSDPSEPSPSPDYPASFHAPDGPGSPASPATIATCDGTVRNLQAAESLSINVDELVFGYLVDIPAGQTRRLIVIQGAGDDGEVVSEVTQKGVDFDPAGRTPGSGILSDLSDADACTVVNWDFSVCGGDSGGGSYDFDDIDINHYRQPTELPDTE